MPQSHPQLHLTGWFQTPSYIPLASFNPTHSYNSLAGFNHTQLQLTGWLQSHLTGWLQSYLSLAGPKPLPQPFTATHLRLVSMGDLAADRPVWWRWAYLGLWQSSSQLQMISPTLARWRWAYLGSAMLKPAKSLVPYKSLTTSVMTHFFFYQLADVHVTGYCLLDIWC